MGGATRPHGQLVSDGDLAGALLGCRCFTQNLLVQVYGHHFSLLTDCFMAHVGQLSSS